MRNKTFSSITCIVISFSFLFAAFVSCGILNGKGSEKSAFVEKKVNSDLSVGNIDSLVADYLSYEDYRGAIMEFLCSSVDFERIQYNRLDGFCRASQQNQVLFDFFDSIREECQTKTYAYLAELSEPELGDYYRNHCDSLPFMKPYLKQNLVDELTNGSYFYTKQIRECFENTDLFPEIDSIYQFQREIVLEIIMEDLNDYYSREDQLIETYRKYTSAIVDEYLYQKSDDIAETCRKKFDKGFFGKLFNHEAGDFQNIEKFAKEQYDQKMNIDTTAIISSTYINEYIEKSEMLKQDFLKEHFIDDIGCSYSTSAPITNSNGLKNYSAPMNDIKAIRGRQKADKAINWGGFATSIVVGAAAGGPVGAAIGIGVDAVDLTWGLFRGKRNSKLDAKSFDDFKDHLYHSTKRAANNFISQQFDELTRQNKSRQEIFRYMICENL